MVWTTDRVEQSEFDRGRIQGEKAKTLPCFVPNWEAINSEGEFFAAGFKIAFGVLPSETAS